MGFWEGFDKYCGVQGILAIGLVGAYIAAPFVDVVLPAGYTEITTFVCGYFFHKNGVPIIKAAASRVTRNK